MTTKRKVFYIHCRTISENEFNEMIEDDNNGIISMLYDVNLSEVLEYYSHISLNTFIKTIKDYDTVPFKVKGDNGKIIMYGVYYIQ